MTVLFVEHVPWESPGRIGEACVARGLTVRTANLLRGDPVPDVRALAGLVVLGGPMRATDWQRYPALETELELLRRAHAYDVPVLGVCLGHQLLGLALGGRLRPDGPREIGVGPVDLTADSLLGGTGQQVDVLHWHGDQVSLPPSAELLARTELCENQAFSAGSALGLQFHLEVDRGVLARWLRVPEMIADVPRGQDVVTDLAAAEPAMAVVARHAFADFAGRAAEQAVVR